MPSLKDNFDELMERVRSGRELGHASYEPIYYLIFPPRQILEVKRSLPAWKARLHNDGWEVQVFSIADQIQELLSQARLMKLWLAADSKTPQAWEKTNQSLANALVGGANALTGGANNTPGGALKERLEARLEQLKDHKKAILLVTDLEALHPYVRIGAIEGQLYGKFYAPTVFFYPGERTGKTRLKFLGFYPEDGNYRSVHVGG